MTISHKAPVSELVADRPGQVLPEELRGDLTYLEVAYFRYVDSGAALPTITAQSDRIFRNHLQLAAVRPAGTAAARVYRPNDGSGLGAAVQIVNDDMPLLVESMVATLRRMGAVVTDVVHPIFEVSRDADGALLTVAQRDSEGNGMPAPSESWIHVQLSPATPAELLDQIDRAVPGLLTDLRQIVDDTPAIWQTEGHLAFALDDAAADPDRLGRSDLADCANLLRWLSDGNFTMLGYARYRLTAAGSRQVPGTGLGVLRDGSTAGMQVPVFGRDRPLLMLTQGSAVAAVHGSVYPYFIGVADYDADGQVIGEQLFVGMFTVTALHANILDIPVIERRVRWVIEWAGFDLNSFSGQAMLEAMQSLPRVELFSSDAKRLFETTSAVLNLGLRRQVRLFLRDDAHSRVISCLVYLPRDRYTTAVRLRMQDILVAELDGEFIDYSARVTESDLASVYFTVRRTEQAGPADTSETNRRHIQELLIEATRTWEDRLAGEAAASGTVDAAVAKRYTDAFTDGYKQDFEPWQGLTDVRRLEQLTDGAIDVHLGRAADAAAGDWRFTLYVAGPGVSLSKVLPLLRSLGVEVMDERPYRIDLPDGRQRWIYVFGLRASVELLRNTLDPNMAAQLLDPGATGVAAPGDAQLRFAAAFEAMWFGRTETSVLNELVLRARLGWREVAALRAYASYLQQAGFAYSMDNISRVLLTHPDAARSFIELFEAYFDPDHPDPALVGEIEAQLRERIDAVVSLDTDRILRAMLGLITATRRTNYYLVDGEGHPRDYLSFKFEPKAIEQLPKPRPQFEIFVYSPRVEGVHLRFGKVARGGLRWSDRREDFRTEILGLVKAQAVKNAVIVPVGAKGGFVVKKPPQATGDQAADRAAQLAEGTACYRVFISGLLDVTDNIDPMTGALIPPARVVRRDGDDSYLVVAADKGTATFSDIANEVAARYRFWLGDAFASGGSVGYDHKAMGITAKGAWEAVKRHFRELDIDTQTTDFTVVGIGDMSGDVFGNGMLCSPHIRLVAAFDHRHIFLDPSPDAAVSAAERRRMFELPRSSWADYNPELISAGGGVFDRTCKSIQVTPQARAALGLADDVTVLSPPEMVRAILLAPVDLLWNGGIGTYVKAAAESNADVGDKSNDAVRVDGNQLRVRVIGEGGNLGATALGRIEYAQAGGKINTDALDNSAGVDCSDHEVNIKILLDRLVAAGELPESERNPLLESMTDEVSELVLRDNVSQNFLMGLSRSDAVAMLNVHRRLIADLVAGRGLDRDLEALPSDAAIERRMNEGRGLTSPELANLMAHVKLALKADLLASDLPEATTFADRLPGYFPTPLRERFGKAIKSHPLRREIVATMLANDMVDYGSITYAFRLAEEIGAAATDAVRAYTAAVEIFGLRGLWHRIRTAPMPTRIRDELELETKRTLDRASRWLLTNRPQPIAIGADINRYATGVRKLTGKVPGWLCGYHITDLVERSRDCIAQGAPPELAVEVFRLIHLFPLLDVLDIADITERDPDEVASLYYALNDHLKIEWLLTAVRHLERGDRWHSLARLAVRDDMYSSLRSLTQTVLAAGEPEESAAEKIAYWESTNQSRLARARAALTEIFATGPQDLATLSVAARQVRSMVSGVSTPSEVAR